MAKVFIEETTLTNIGDAIRGKEGSSALVPVTDMATRITNLPSGGGGGADLPDEAFLITGDCRYRFTYGGWDWFLEEFVDKLTTQEISKCDYMFYSSNIEQIPFDINIKDVDNLSYMFHSAGNLTTPPKIRGTIKWGTSTKLGSLLYGCSNLRDMEDVFTPEMLDSCSTVKVTSSYSSPALGNMLCVCYSLRQIPSWWYKLKLNPESTAFPSASNTIYYSGLSTCTSLDEATNIPVWRCAGAQTSNMLSSTFSSCYRVKDITFETNPDGSPIEVKWKTQTIDLSSYIGFGPSSNYVLNNNSGITADKQVTDDASYQALKDDPDWFTTNKSYSRYNHDSAVATINSLPDTSAYLASAGGTNTIKFNGSLGALTDGGAINTLTAEEIAVATAKGWTVTLS